MNVIFKKKNYISSIIYAMSSVEDIGTQILKKKIIYE